MLSQQTVNVLLLVLLANAELALMHKHLKPFIVARNYVQYILNQQNICGELKQNAQHMLHYVIIANLEYALKT